jgi:hypothetical protein
VKIFWSWQSDTPGDIGRHFVRKALEEALAQLKQEPEIEEPAREDLHLDHDRKGIPGSPDLAATILAKIRDASIFVADVTPIGKSESGRALLNPNVAIELGYALAHIGNEGLLMILNGAFGDRESLPFDLRHKAGPIFFNIGANAASDERKRVHRELTRTLQTAIGDCLREIQKRRPSETHEEIGSRSNVAQYFDDGEILAERPSLTNRFQLAYQRGPLLYLRLIPTRVMSRLRETEIKDIVFGINLQPLAQHVGGGASWERNRCGGITYSFIREADEGYIFTSSQVFHNREVWGVDATLLAGGEYIPSVAFEEMLEAGLKHYIQLTTERLGLRSPIVVEAGAARVEGFRMAMGDHMYWGPVYAPQIRSRQTLRSFDETEVNRVLLAIFDDFFDAVGELRPQHFRGFPPNDNGRRESA